MNCKSKDTIISLIGPLIYCGAERNSHYYSLSYKLSCSIYTCYNKHVGRSIKLVSVKHTLTLAILYKKQIYEKTINRLGISESGLKHI